MHVHIHTHRRARTLQPMKRHCIVELIRRKGIPCTNTSTHTQESTYTPAYEETLHCRALTEERQVMHIHLHTHRRARTLRPMKSHCIVELIQRKGMSYTYTYTHTGEHVHSGL